MEQLIPLINFLGDSITLAILAQVIMSWLIRDPYNQYYRWICRLTDPILGPIRRIMPNLGGIDLSPIIAIFAINIIRDVSMQLLR